MDDRLDATDGNSRADSPATEETRQAGRFRRGLRWMAGTTVAGALTAAVLPVLDGHGLSERTAVGRVVAVAATNGQPFAGKVLVPAVTVTPADDPTVSRSRTSSPSPYPSGISTTPPETPPPQLPPPDEGTLFGTSLDFTVGGGFESWVEHVDDRFGTLPVVRAFNPAFPRSWSATDTVEGRTVVVSFKAHPQEVRSGRLDGRLREWFAGAPDTGEIYWSYFHEPEDDIGNGEFTAEEFREAWKHIQGIAEDVGKHNQFATLILMSWTADPESGREFADYYPGDEYVDVLGWDSYNFAYADGGYAGPKEMFGRVIELSGEVGKPWGIAATGSPIVDGDDGSKRAEWLSRVGAYLDDERALWVTYFEADAGMDFRLHDEESRQAWGELVRSSAREDSP